MRDYVKCMIEQWQKIPGIDPCFEVSSLGRVRSLSRTAKGRGGSIRNITGRIIRQATLPNGYQQVTLKTASGPATYRVHRLVALAFLGEEPIAQKSVGLIRYAIVAHGDGDRKNNRLDNLRWASAEENAADRKLHGTARQGESHPNSKLNDEIVRDIRVRATSKQAKEELARHYGISTGTVYAIVARRAWASVA